MAKGVAQRSPFNYAAFPGVFPARLLPTTGQFKDSSGSADLAFRSAAFPALLRSPAAELETNPRTQTQERGLRYETTDLAT
jgi:hypothetical protein